MQKSCNYKDLSFIRLDCEKQEIDLCLTDLFLPENYNSLQNIVSLSEKIAFGAGAPRGPKVRGVRDIKSSLNLPLESKNSLFIVFS